MLAKMISCCLVISFVGAELAYAQDNEIADSGNGFEIVDSKNPKLIVWQDIKDSTGAVVSLSELRGHPFAVLVFRGHGCYRCAIQLKKFSQHEALFRRRGIRLIGVTNETVSVMNNGLITAPQPFPVFSDSRLKLATEYGAQRGDNWHGIVLVDAIGKVRWSATGQKPFMDYRKVLSVADEKRLTRPTLSSHSIKSAKRTSNE